MRLHVAGLLLLSSVLGQAKENLLWQDPGAVQKIDFRYPTVSFQKCPEPPFRFESEEGGGTSPKILVIDKNGYHWRAKGGLEVKSESFAIRLVSAMGYFVEPMCFVPEGKIEGIAGLSRAAGFVQPDGKFYNASFELRDPQYKYLTDQDWSYTENPFVGSRELHGLKLLAILLSNWDNKDIRDKRMGSNTGIWERGSGAGLQRIYFVNDWGQTLGSWGSELKPKGWDCAAFASQTDSFLSGGGDQPLKFGFVGQHTESFTKDLTVDDIRWLLKYLGRITDDQIRTGLQVNGATPAEVTCFSNALRERIRKFQQVSGQAPQPAK